LPLTPVPGLPGEFTADTGTFIAIVVSSSGANQPIATYAGAAQVREDIPIGGGATLPGWIINIQRGRKRFVATVFSASQFFELAIDNGQLVRFPLGSVNPANPASHPNFGFVVEGL
jgi:hypothetical protein